MLAGYRVLAAVALVGLIVNAARAADPPQMQVDPFWPKPLPNNWVLGQVAGVAVDAQDHVWIIQRPRSLTPDERGATLVPPRSNCCTPAPPVIEFDPEGNVVQAWSAAEPEVRPSLCSSARGAATNYLLMVSAGTSHRAQVQAARAAHQSVQGLQTSHP